MFVKVYVGLEDAIKAGKSASGLKYLQLTDEFLGSLSAEERTILAGRCTETAEDRYDRVSAMTLITPEYTLESVRESLQKAVADSAKAAAEKESKRQADISSIRDAYDRRAVITKDATYLGVPYDIVEPDFPYIYDRHSLIESMPDVAAWMEEIDDANKRSYGRAKALREEADALRELNAKAEEQRKRDAAEQYNAAANEWIRQWGTDSQRERLEAGVLPAQERDNCIRDHLFQPGDMFARYEKLKSSNIVHAGSCQHDEDVTFSVENFEKMSEHHWDQFKMISSAFLGANVVSRIHTGTCDDCAESIESCSALVTINWHGRDFSREYSIE